MVSKVSVFCLMGPTASGKTDLAIEFCQRFPFEIISVDSAMVYQGMDIGSAKPDRETLKKAPHHLIDLISPNKAYSAANFCQDAKRVIEQVIAKGNIPLLVGGTMMYFRALQQGLSDMPAADEAVRQAINDQAKELGWEALYRQLAQVDAVAANQIHSNDSQRIQRALEVYRLTGTPISIWWQKQKQKQQYHFVNMALFPQKREFLHACIARRLHHMIADGFLEEVKGLVAKWSLNADMPSMRSVGYRQAWLYLNGELDYQQFVDKSIVATRQLAKRQLTWLRTWPNTHYLEPSQINLPIQIHDLISSKL